ncbi:MAG TPA: MaoC family dehydratase [Thermomonospora sp.]|nr:MaoC family dehydratase [Thermomonospora sp.]
MTTATGLAEIKALAGRDLGHSAWLDVTQERVNTFADATDDHQWIHVDPTRAEDGPFGGTIAHGYLTLSLVIPLFNDLLDIQGTKMSINYGLEKVRFPSPVRVGSKIRLAATVASVEDVPGNGVQMLCDFTVEIDGSTKPACVARVVYRHYA